MRYVTSVLLACFIFTTSSSQSYLGKIIKQVNFREGPGVEYKIIGILRQSTQVFVISSNLEGEFYNIIDIESNKEGYVHKSYIKIGSEIPRNSDGIFSPSGTTNGYDAELEIFNNTSKVLTLRLNDENFTFQSGEKRTLKVTPGTYEYRASAPNVIPDYGTETVKSNSAYTWRFFIITRHK